MISFQSSDVSAVVQDVYGEVIWMVFELFLVCSAAFCDGMNDGWNLQIIV